MARSLIRRSLRAVTVLSALGVALVLARPVATQQRTPRGGAIVTVNGHDATAGDVPVKYRGSVNDQDVQDLDAQMDADQNERVGGNGVRRVHSRSFDTQTLLAFLRTDARVVYAEPNYVLHAVATPNDPRFPSLWGLNNTGQN